MEALLAEELKKLQTDHIDFYLMHGINRQKWEYFKSIGAPEFFDDMKRAGRIRYKCFSFHGPYEEFEYILKDCDWDMVQIQYNFMDVDNQAGTRGVTLAGEKGVPVVIMEGLLGGKLAKVPAEVGSIFEEAVPGRSAAEWGFRWLCNHKEIVTVLSGVTDLAQVEDNLRIFSEAAVGGMSDKELAAVERARAAYQKRIRVGCTGCEYCLPCPKGVAIPEVFATWNEVYQFEEENLQGNRSYARLVEKGKGADLCVSCRKCQNLCPQHLNIPDLLAQAHDSMK
jgi:predicted aldo/keto reductase-like oxidoreductase